MTSQTLRRLLAATIIFAQSTFADQSIYSDSLLNGWENWSWASVNLSGTSPVHSGNRSVTVNAGAWQALYLHHASFDSSSYTHLSFWVHGGVTGGQRLLVQAQLNGTPQTAVALSPLSANTWQQVTLSLASLGAANQPNFDGFWIQDSSGTTQPTFYVDDVALTAPPPPSSINVAIDATQTIRSVDPRHFGINAAVWDSVFDTPNTIAMLTDMDNRALRFPGGSLSNEYHWATNTSGSNTWTWATSFDTFAHVATTTGAEVFISVNYGTGTPAEAADWVRYSNVTKGYGFKYWEIGNENYGTWETDQQPRRHDPFTYATRFKDYFSQMKAADPTIKIGAVVVTGEDSYANYSDHPATNPRTSSTHNGWTPVLLSTLRTLGVTPDFIIFHRYAQGPGGENDAGLLNSSGTWKNDAADLRQQLTDYLGATGASVELVCTENNSVYTSPGKQTTSLVNGLFLADSLGQAMQTEFNAVIWWDTRNAQETGNNNSPSLYGWRQYGDYGITSGANPAGPADRYPTFYVAKLLKHFARGGDQLVRATSNYNDLAAYATKRANGSLALLVINKSPSTALSASIAVNGFTPGANAIVRDYGIPQDEAARTGSGQMDIAETTLTSAGTSFTHTFAPYSATVITMSASSTPPPPVVATPTISPSGGTFSAPCDVTLSDSTPGATIRYTLNGSDPTSTSTLYNNVPFTLANSATVKARAFASGMTESSVASATFAITLPPTIPTAPTTLTATRANQKGRISLSWNAVSGATGYIVKQSTTNGGPYSTIATVTTTSYTNTGLTSGRTYYYVVSAANAAGESPNSAQASATAK
jgi:alpha-L-arabinofuranosidase